MNGSQQATLLSRLVTAALIGALLGLLDFVLFELRGNLAGLREYVLYKPSLLGLSSLSSQMLSCTACGIFCFSFFHLAWLILGKLVRTRETFSLLSLSSAALVLGMIALRVYAEASWPQGFQAMVSRQAYRLSILIVGSTVLVFYVFLLECCHVRPVSSWAARFALSLRSQSSVLFLLIVASLFAPDVYSGLMRIGCGTKAHHSKGPNVLFIVLDTVRADHLSCYGYKRVSTPNIDRIASEGVRFLNALSAAPWTLPSHASMFTGLYPSQHQADWGNAHLNEGFPTLAERMRDARYQTVGFSENVFVGRSFGLARGFGEFYETWRRPLLLRAFARIATGVFHYKQPSDHAPRSLGLFERWVLNNNPRGKPFFAFINLMAAHLPRYPRPGFSAGKWTKESLAKIESVNLLPERYYLPKYKLNQQQLAMMVDIYDAEITYLDSQIGDLISFLTKAGILDETVVILTSDHGENFGDHGLFEHQFCLYNTLLHVPLIIRYPPLLRPDRVEKDVSTVFLYKTILAMLAIPRSEAPVGSQVDPLAQLKNQDFVIAEYSNGVEMLKGTLGNEGLGLDFAEFDKSLKCVVEGGYKFIWSSSGKHEVYRLESDPGEVENVIEKEKDRARALQQALDRWKLSTPRKLLF